MIITLECSKKARPLRSAVLVLFSFTASFLLFLSSISSAGERPAIDLGLSAKYYREGQTPEGWKLRKGFFTQTGKASWVMERGVPAVRLSSTGSLTFLEKSVDIDLREFPVVAWRWKVDNILKGIDERTVAGDDHPIRIFLVFEPDTAKQSLWLRLKRFVYMDRYHGHPTGGRFTEYVWASELKAGDVINDPGKPKQKLMVVEGGASRLGRWLSYERNLYEDFKSLYGEEPRRLIFIGILNDTDQTGQSALSYIADLAFHGAADGD